MTGRSVGIVILTSLAIAAGCGGTLPSQTAVATRLYSCDGSGSPPPAKLVIPGNPISGSWNVAVVESVTNLSATAEALATRYGGQVKALFPSLGVFNIAIPDEQARALSLDPAVCYVEQDAWVTAARG